MESRKRDGGNNTPLFVIIDDLHDICSQEENLHIIEEMMKKTDRTNIHFILATDTPEPSIITDNMKYDCKGVLYLTLAPGEEKDFDFKSELTKSEWDYTTTIGNAVLKENDKRTKIRIPLATDEDIEALKN